MEKCAVQAEGKLRDIQLKTLEIMRYFDLFCKEHHLRYFIAGGTLLGAVRHRGFIPWDDDVDIAMPRADYDRLIGLRNTIESPYNLRNWESEDNLNFLFAKLEDTGTYKKEIDGQREYIGGISIDIFPQDGVPNDENIRSKYLRRFAFYKTLRDYDSDIECKTARQKLYKLISEILKKIKKIQHYETFLENMCRKYKYDECKYVRSYYGVYGAKETYEKALHGAGCLLEFEGLHFCAPLHWHEYLTQMYGDYMTLPPEEKRKTTHNMNDFSLTIGYRRNK